MFVARNNALDIHYGGNMPDRGRAIHQAPPMLQQAAPVLQQFANSIAQMQFQLPAYQSNIPTYTTMTIPNKRGPPPLVSTA
jgi:hypothetical protein